MPRPKLVSNGFFIDLGVFDSPLGGGRRVRAYAPHGHVQDRPRPVLWLLDGQNVFGNEGSFAGGWHAHEAIDRFAALKKPVAPVIVAVDHGHEKRIDELTPWRDGNKGGGADDFIGWVVEELMPVVRRSVGGLRDAPESNIIGGSSLGGLAAFYAHFRFPHAFGGALAMSPSFWFARRKIFEFVVAQSMPWKTRVYLDCGAREGRGMMIKHAREMSEHLGRHGWGDDKMMWRPDAKGTHAERHWRRRLPKALRFLFR